MLKSPYLFAVSVLLTLLSWMAFDAQVKAAESKLALSFDLAPVKTQAAEPPSVKLPSIEPSQADNALGIAQRLEKDEIARGGNSLPVPTAPIPVRPGSLSSTNLTYSTPPLPPLSGEPSKSQPAEAKPAKPSTPNQKDVSLFSENGPNSDTKDIEQEIGLSFPTDELTLEAPSPIAPMPVASTTTDSESIEVVVEALSVGSSEPDDMRLLFAPTDLETALESVDVEPIDSVETKSNEVSVDETPEIGEQVSFEASGLGDWIFQDGSDSLVARTVGSAEGTRHWSGDRTIAYYGHVDPGNGVWNLGTFSYQHGANSPEEADEKQLRRLKRQGSQLEAKAKNLGIKLSLEEKLNALDLANQAPLAALDRGGYIERLAQAHRLGMTGEEAILWARTYAYLDPDTRAWNAPGLGNNVRSISRDQERRIGAIAKALKAFEPRSGRSSALENLQNISLEDTASRPAFSSQPPSDLPTSLSESDLLNIAASFELPPSTVASSDSLPDIQATPEPVEQSSTPPAIEQVSVADGIGVAFSSTEALAPIVQVERSALTSSEAAKPRAQETTSVESRSAEDIFELNADLNANADDTEVDRQNVDSEANLESQVALTQAESTAEAVEVEEAEARMTETAIAETEVAADAIAEAAPTETTRQERLNELVTGIISRDESNTETKENTDTEATNTEAANVEAATTENRLIWRVESKVRPQK